MQFEIEQLAAGPAIPDRMLEIFESIPVSYVTVHYALLSPGERESFQSFLDYGVETKRLRFIRSFEARADDGTYQRTDLYSVTKTEPNSLN